MFNAPPSRQVVAALTTLAAALAGGLVLAPAADGADSSKAKPKLETTSFAFFGKAFDSKMTTGQPPVTSGKTAYSVIACTNQSGKKKTNSITSADLGGGVTLGAVKTVVRTYQKGDETHSVAKSRLASVNIDGGGGSSLSVQGFTTRADTWYGNKGFQAKTSANAVLIYSPAVGEPYEVPFPEEGGAPIELPGFGTISGPRTNINVNGRHAYASATGLRINVTSTQTDLMIGRAASRISRNSKYGVMRGNAYGSQASLLDGTVVSGRTALQPLHCQGTNGKVFSNSTSEFAIPDAGEGGVTVSKARGVFDKEGMIDAWTRSSVATFDLGGQAIINAVKANANVHRSKSGKITSNAKGTTPGSITLSGQTEELPIQDGQEIPGVARFRTNVIEKTKTGIRVVALRIRLLGGSPGVSVVELGNANARITRN